MTKPAKLRAFRRLRCSSSLAPCLIPRDGRFDRMRRAWLHLIRSRPHYSRKTPPELDFQRDPFLLETNVPGIFVAGDVRHGSIKRVASAVGEGSIAIELIHQYLNRF